MSRVRRDNNYRTWLIEYRGVSYAVSEQALGWTQEHADHVLQHVRRVMDRAADQVNAGPDQWPGDPRQAPYDREIRPAYREIRPAYRAYGAWMEDELGVQLTPAQAGWLVGNPDHSRALDWDAPNDGILAMQRSYNADLDRVRADYEARLDTCIYQGGPGAKATHYGSLTSWTAACPACGNDTTWDCRQDSDGRPQTTIDGACCRSAAPSQ